MTVLDKLRKPRKFDIRFNEPLKTYTYTKKLEEKQITQFSSCPSEMARVVKFANQKISMDGSWKCEVTTSDP